jgi:hypothetical protein
MPFIPRRAVLGLSMLILSLAGCADSDAATTAPTRTWGKTYMTGAWLGALGMNEEYDWTFAADGKFKGVDPAGKQPAATGRWSVDGTTLRLAVVDVRGNTAEEPFVAKVIDADHVELGSKDFGAVFKLRRKTTATTAPTTRP